MINLQKLLTDEITPKELEQVMDDAYYIISQLAIKAPETLPQGHHQTADVLHYLHRLKKTLNKVEV